MEERRKNDETSAKAILSFVFGILAITGTCFCIGAPIAIVLGMGEPGGLARAGVILGWIHLAMCAILLFVGLLLLLVAGGTAAFQ